MEDRCSGYAPLPRICERFLRWSRSRLTASYNRNGSYYRQPNPTVMRPCSDDDANAPKFWQREDGPESQILKNGAHKRPRYNRRVLTSIVPAKLARSLEPFDDPAWLFELKHDGFQCLGPLPMSFLSESFKGLSTLKVSDNRKLDCLKQYILRSIPHKRIRA
jgi:hypothetical protein